MSRAEESYRHDGTVAAGYNGWKNYETWAVALWIDNEQGAQAEAQERARAAAEGAADNPNVPNIWTEAQAARFTLAEEIRDWVCDELIPDLGATLAADLMGAALSEVDWNELAEHYLDDIGPERDERANGWICPNCGQYRRINPAGGGADCFNECRKRGFTPTPEGA